MISIGDQIGTWFDSFVVLDVFIAVGAVEVHVPEGGVQCPYFGAGQCWQNCKDSQFNTARTAVKKKTVVLHL